ncbi:hypothetical protein QBC34DRAFT_463794 [Podospora aff. communis PSN243]|uniref:Uncharacterized protein n=1 Tax=Podospora aff. communis PSN243 TaxID=3040156 RepID=A0AAV9GKT7_9PEZI|nr:hypothetical protein QBC34DRAFT_463794 [Podospora aff. communis PSN243]
MVLPNPSIQSFYQKDNLPPPARPAPSVTWPSSDGFSPEEVSAALRPVAETWKPKGEYDDVQIGDLLPGPARVRFTGRIVNFSASKDGSPRRAVLPQGFHFLVVKDHSGVVAIKLLATGVDYECIQLGKLVTVWACFIAEYTSSFPFRIPFVSSVVTIHPSQTSGSCIKFHRELPGSKEITLCRTPLDYDHGCPSSQIPSLMNLKAYLNSGHEGVVDPRILLCVSSIGPRKVVRPKAVPEDVGVADLETIEVSVFDETESCILRLWEDKVPSAKTWIPGQTILLITNPRCRPADKKRPNPELSITLTSMVDVDPDFAEADWLRKMAANRTRKESVYIPFHEDLWDAETAMDGPDRTSFTLADIDELARESPNRIFTGRLSLIILGVKIAEHCRKNQLCCTECCGVPLYANRPHAVCKNCLGERALALNPRIIGPLADETGCIAPGKLIWSQKAWTELFYGTGSYMEEAFLVKMVECTVIKMEDNGAHDAGCSWRGLTALDSNGIRSVEEKLQYSRITLVFGWSSEVGRLSVLGVEW